MKGIFNKQYMKESIKKVQNVGIIFDMDGTLIDTEKYYNVCWCEAIAKFGYTITKEEALDLRSLGRPHVYRFF